MISITKRIYLTLTVVVGVVIPTMFASAASTGTRYAPQSGDTLESISKRFYGTNLCWTVIASVNPDAMNTDATAQFTTSTQLAIPKQSQCEITRANDEAFTGATLVKREGLEYVHRTGGWVNDGEIRMKYVTPEENRSRLWLDTSRLQGVDFMRLKALQNVASTWLSSSMMESFLDASGVQTSETDPLYRPQYPWTDGKAHWKILPADRLKEVKELTQSIDGKSWGYRVFDAKTKKISYVINGKRSTAWNYADNFVMKPDGTRWAYRAQLSNGTWNIITDRGSYGPYRFSSPPVLMADGRIVNVVIDQVKGVNVYHLIQDGTRMASYDFISDLTYANHAQDLAYIARQQSHWFVVRNNKPSQAWDYVDELNGSPLTTTFSYRARSADGQWYLASNDQSWKLPWEPSHVMLDVPNDTPVAVVDSAEFDETKYGYLSKGTDSYNPLEIITPTTDWKFNHPIGLQAVDSRGRILSIQYSDGTRDVGLATLFINDRKIGVIRIGGDVAATQQPGESQTFYSFYFDEHDQLVIYRYEGRVITRSTYRVY